MHVALYQRSLMGLAHPGLGALNQQLRDVVDAPAAQRALPVQHDQRVLLRALGEEKVVHPEVAVQHGQRWRVQPLLEGSNAFEKAMAFGVDLVGHELAENLEHGVPAHLRTRDHVAGVLAAVDVRQPVQVVHRGPERSMQLGQLVHAHLGLREVRTDDLIADVVVGEIVHQDHEGVVRIDLREVDAGSLRRADRVELCKVANLPGVGVVLHRDQAIVLDRRRLFDHECGRRAVAIAFVGHRQAGEVAHHSGAFTEFFPGNALDAGPSGQRAAAVQNLGQPRGADVGGGWGQWMDGHRRPPGCTRYPGSRRITGCSPQTILRTARSASATRTADGVAPALDGMQSRKCTAPARPRVL